MNSSNSNGRTPCHAPITAAEREASDRIAVLTLAEKLFTMKEYTQLCADVATGRVEIRMYDDGIVLTRKF
jgi:hypothetical protein